MSTPTCPLMRALVAMMVLSVALATAGAGDEKDKSPCQGFLAWKLCKSYCVVFDCPDHGSRYVCKVLKRSIQRKARGIFDIPCDEEPVPTTAPTSPPTSPPTTTPTSSPSKAPTGIPTNRPSMDPTEPELGCPCWTKSALASIGSQITLCETCAFDSGQKIGANLRSEDGSKYTVDFGGGCAGTDSQGNEVESDGELPKEEFVACFDSVRDLCQDNNFPIGSC